MNWPARHPLAAIVIAGVFAILCGVSASRLHFDASLQSLFPRNDPAASALVRVLDHFPLTEEMLVLVRVPGDEPDPDRLLSFAGRLEHRIEQDPRASKLITSISYRTDAASRDFFTKVLVPNAIFYLNDAEMNAAMNELTPAEMATQIRQDETMLAAPGPAVGGIAKAVLRDPLRLHEFIEQHLAGTMPLKTYQNSDAFIAPDGRALLIRIAGAKPPSDLQFCNEITREVSALAGEANSDHLILEFSGAYPIAAKSERSIRADSISSVIGSVACLAALFMIAFRRPLPLFVVTFLPVALGAVYGFGVYALIDHGISPLMAVIGAMLAGIGIDYSIFYLLNYLHQRAGGRDSAEASAHVLSNIGGALIAAWVTSAVGFIAVGFASVPALREFSILGSLGLAGALLGAIFILPALLALLDRAWPMKGVRFSIRPALNWIDRRGNGCLAIAGCVVVIAVVYLAWTGPWLGLQTDPTVLHPQPDAPLDAQADIAREMGSAPDSLIVYLHADSPGQLLTLAHHVSERLASAEAKSAGVKATFGLASLLPDPAIAARRRSRITPAAADRVTSDFDAAIANSALNPAAFESYKQFLRLLLTPARPPGIDDLVSYHQLAGSVLPREAFHGTAPTEAITLVFLNQSLDERQARLDCITKLRALLGDLPGATLTGMSVLSLDSEMTIHHDMPRLIIAAVVICALYLLIHFRSVPQALLAVVPTICSLVCLLAVAKFAGAKMNLANMIAVPLLIGVDIDYGIFLVSAARRSASREELIDRIFASAHAVILCASATLLGFGSLAFTSVPAVRSLGWAVAIGVFTCALAALFILLPLLLRIRGRFIAKAIPALAIACFVSLGAGCQAPSGRLSFPAEPVMTTSDVQWYDVHHNGKPQFGIARDSSGRVDRLLYDDLGTGHITREYRLSDYANARVPHLILLLDSIPFETMRERYEAGDFRWFDPPQKMIAPFPSLTEVCYGDVLHAPPLPGTIDEYFDPRDQQKKDILWARVKGFEQPWERRLAYHANYLEQGLSFLDPDSWYAAELEKARQALEQSPDRVTVVYIASAASMVCKYGKPGAEKVLDGARQLCLQLLYERRGAIKITMMADHGHNYTPSKNVPLADYLKEADFHPAESLRADRDCVLEINALVTCAGVHTFHPAQVAAALCRHEQIELATYVDGSRVIIQSAKGTAAIECRHGLLRYLPLTADVLGYAPLISRLKSQGVMDADGFAADDVWFNQTLDDPWPNVPRRAWDALHGRFITTPTVLLSLKDGYYAGYPQYENYIKMASTHGGLNQVNSATFAITMTGRLTKPVRHEDVIGVVEPGFEPRVLR